MPDMGSLEGKVAVVTGAAQGIGAAYARRLAEIGAAVVVADIDGEGAGQTAKQLVADGLRAVARRVDIADAASTAELAASVVDELGSIDVLVNNAAIYKGLQMEVAEDIELDYWRRMVDVNISGTYYMCRAVIPQMRRQRSGRIVNQSSIAHYIAAPMALHYCTTKGAVVAMTKALASELGEDNIRVNCIAPGIIGTEATLTSVPPMLQDMLVMQAALGRMGTPEDLLGALEFLCTSASEYVTGQTLVVDGGVFKLG
jgi:NAD(P)-dependent dehydrogenase (short-subunit alcohol dehydrogenase family)